MNHLKSDYSFIPYSIRNFNILNQETLLEILDWRNDIKIREWMYDTDKIAIDNHLTFCKSLKYNSTKGYWLVSKGSNNIGVFNVTNYDKINKKGEIGFYVNPKYFRSGFGLYIFFLGLDLLFTKTELETICGFVKLNNKNALMLNDFFNLKETQKIMINNEVYSERIIQKEIWELKNLRIETLMNSFTKFILKNRNNI